jgi:hypothetical protein
MDSIGALKLASPDRNSNAQFKRVDLALISRSRFFGQFRSFALKVCNGFEQLK